MTEKTNKRCLFIAVLLTGLLWGAGPVAASPRTAPSLDVTSASVILLDEATGRVLLSKNADAPRAVASTTKIMTALLVLEKARQDDEVVVSPRAAGVSGGTIGLAAGERRQVRELLNALLLASANDAAVALAEHIGGSEAGFAKLMNERAKQLGAVNTEFVNPHGLPAGRSNYSTARELAAIALEAMKQPRFRQLVATRRYSWETTDSVKPQLLTNTNYLLQKYPAATGIKTGYTFESGYCLVASAVKGKRSAIAVVLGSPSRDDSFNDARRMLEWGLNSFEMRPVVQKNRRYGTLTRAGKSVPLVAEKSIVDLVYSGAEGGPVLKSTVVRGIKLPVKKGQRLGELAVIETGKKIGSVRLVAGRSVASPYITKNLGDYFWRVVKKIENLL